ncbi:MAG: leucyl/phenylalanyl-tRNA--protein transferase [Ignavibacteria bacterium]|nr:MAG: leucyl/phenylalanyl-tRNA--protein transferase [Ignavibacteria bacterium]
MPVIPPDDLLGMYASGIFPMADGRDGPIMLFSPDPRTIIDPAALHISKSLGKTIRAGRFDVRMNTSFENVMRICAEREDTWISEDIIASYVALHERGAAHSVEIWAEGEMVGGLYGVAEAGAFFGESMFHIRRDASKIALWVLCEHMLRRGMPLLDVQYSTPHLLGLGAFEISREEYLKRLDSALSLPVSFF